MIGRSHHVCVFLRLSIAGLCIVAAFLRGSILVLRVAQTDR